MQLSVYAANLFWPEENNKNERKMVRRVASVPIFHFSVIEKGEDFFVKRERASEFYP